MKTTDKALQKWPWLVLGLFSLLLIIRCRFTFCQTDESFYLSTVHRFYLGNLPVVDIWDTTQFYSILLLPLYSLYRAIVGSATGVYLAARLCFTAITCAMGCWIYCALKHRGYLQALISALLFMAYSKANISGFSYYNLCLYFLTAGALILYRTDLHSRALCLRGALAGAIMALAVLCNPVAAVGWVILLPGLFVPRFSRFRRLSLSVLGGTLFSAAAYLVWLFSRIQVAQLFEAIPNLLNDPEANSSSSNIVSLLLGMVSAPAHFLPTSPLWVGALAVTLWFGLVKKQQLSTAWKQRLLIIAAAAFVINVALSGNILGQAHTALCLFGFQCWLLAPAAQRSRREFGCFFVPGLALAAIWQLSSNTRFSGMTIGFALSAIAAAGMVQEGMDACFQTCTKKRQAAFALLLILPVLMSGWQRIALEYRDAPLSECTQQLTGGPAAGLYTSPEHAAQYEAVVALLQSPEIAQGDGPLMISSLLPWGYLCTDRPCGVPNTWRTPLDHAQLESYYEQQPDNFPTTVVVLNPEVGSYVSTLQPEHNDEANVNHLEGSYMLVQLQTRGYTATQYDLATVYQAP